MACETMLKQGQTLAQRKSEVLARMTVIDRLIAQRKATVKVGPQGAITFSGISAADRDGITDACVYRMISRSGSAGAKMAIQRAEQVAGRAVDRKQLTAGVHSHDHGQTWSAH